MSVRHASAIPASVALAGVLALSIVGCNQDTEDKIVGTWVTGQGDTAGHLVFTENGMMKQNLKPPVAYKIVGNKVFTVLNGKDEVAGQVDWISDDRFTYTVLGSVGRGSAYTYQRQQ